MRRLQASHTLPSIDSPPLDRFSVRNPMTPAWIVCAWPPVLWQADSPEALAFVHLGTRVISYGDAEHPPTGQTLWGKASNDRSAGVAWDWVEVQDGVVAMADPLGVVTNLRLLDARGSSLNAFEVAVRLNGIVHRLPWQSEVQRALHPHAA